MGPGSFDPGNSRIPKKSANSQKASMGPGSFDPGNTPGRTPATASSPRFNGAGVFRPRKYRNPQRPRRRSSGLQWGRGLSTPEISSHPLRRHNAADASMGPGSFDPGNPDSRCKTAAAFWASMGPGSFDPGNSPPSLYPCPRKLLQWGRGLSTPEIRPRSRSTRANGPLQWGRGLSTPEIRATPRPHWPPAWASMGPGSFDPGN